MPRRHPHDQGTTELLAELAHVLTVHCPACGAPRYKDCVKPYKHPPRAKSALGDACSAPPYGCGAAATEPCVVPHGSHRGRGPSCWARVTAADVAHPDGAHPALPPEPPARPAPGRRLLPAEDVRPDIAQYRVLCGWCSRPIVWATTDKHTQSPVDAEPGPGGDLALTVDACGPRCRHQAPTALQVVDHCGPRCRQLTAQQLPAAHEHGQDLHTPHRKTCPQGTRPTWTRGVRHGRP